MADYQRPTCTPLKFKTGREGMEAMRKVDESWINHLNRAYAKRERAEQLLEDERIKRGEILPHSCYRHIYR